MGYWNSAPGGGLNTPGFLPPLGGQVKKPEPEAVLQDHQNFFNLQENKRQADLQAALAREAAADKNNRFASVMARFDSGLNNTQGPQITKAADLPTEGVFNPEAIQSMKNVARSRALQGAATQSLKAGEGAASRGFGANSPLLQAIQANLGMQGRSAGESDALNADLTAQQANAENIFRSREANAGIHNDYMQNLIARFQVENAGKNALYQMLAGAF